LKTNSKAIQNALEYYPFRALIALLGALPYRICRAIIMFLFMTIGYHLRIRRDVADTQIRHVYPTWSTAKINCLIRGIYRQMALNILEEYFMDDSALSEKSIIVGSEYMQEARNLGKGVLMAAAHFGNWEAARILPLQGIPLSVIVKKQRNTLFDAYTNAIRTRSGMHIIDMKHGLRKIISDLSEKRVVAIMADQNAGSKGIILDFLGYPASHWKGVAKLSLRYQIPIVPGFVIRSPEDKIIFEFSKMIYHPELEDNEENIAIILNKIIRITEDYIHKYPDHWFWVHKRWKHGYDMFKGKK
jgi:KDO2-lipid IV(A) lauroyltransferase